VCWRSPGSHTPECESKRACSGRPKEVIDEEKERMWQAQQEVLKARREGRALEGVSERRAAAKRQVSSTFDSQFACRQLREVQRTLLLQALEKEEKKEADRRALARGEKPADDEPYEPYGKEDEGLQGGILIPLAPFGIPKFDNGERFDLKVCKLLMQLR
jgi:hypothetical protein